MAVRHPQTIKHVNGKCFCGIFNIVVKSVNFWNEGTFTRISSLQDERVILKWNDLYSLDKALFYLYTQLQMKPDSF